MTALSQCYSVVMQRLEDAACVPERPASVRLLAVSKTRSADEIRALAALGQRAFGENYVQEGCSKALALADLALDWHLIGHLQSNKCREAAETFDWVQSLDRAKLIEPLNRFRPAERPPLNVLIQVNVDGESSKSGCAPGDIAAIADAIARTPRLRLRGLMAIPEPTPDHGQRSAGFRRMRSLFDALISLHPDVDTLSMGMSEDFELAIAEGATMVRLGSILFGPRGMDREQGTQP